MKTDRTQEFRRASLKLLEEAQDVLTQGRQIFSPGMKVQMVLFELAPELLNRIAPGGIGRQLDDLDGQMPLPTLLDRLLGRNLGPIPRELDWIEPLLLFQSQQDIGMEMHGPIVLNNPNALGTRIGPTHQLIEASHLLRTYLTPGVTAQVRWGLVKRCQTR